MNIIGIIPARYGSTRFPGKPLAEIAGKPLVRRVWERVSSSGCFSRVIIATDDIRIFETAKAFGAETVMTSAGHKSGTDRIAQACRNIKADVVVNVQGDEPLIPASTLKSVVGVMRKYPGVLMATAVRRISADDDISNPNIVKVVLDKDCNALYFSRSPVPFNADEYYKHIGIYAFRRDFLMKFVGMKVSKLEKTEKLEQLRALENGYRIRAAIVKHDSIPVDVPEDAKKVENYLCRKKIQKKQ
jgi:3-deoxy-manno-octulosonate cytidylyltransferase (CMP-KDO synthetase)